MQEGILGEGTGTHASVAWQPAPEETASSRLRDWIREGLRAALFQRFRVPSPEPTALQLLALLAATSAFDLLLARIVIPGAAQFSLGGWLAPWWTIAISLLLAWSLFKTFHAASRPPGPVVAAWYALLAVSVFPLGIASAAYELAWYRQWLPDAVLESSTAGWAVSVALWLWQVIVAARIAAALGLLRAGQALLAAGLAALYVLNAYAFSNARPWYPTEQEEEKPHRPRFVLSQETFEIQQGVWTEALHGLRPHRKGIRDVYGIVFAPYASEDVFRRESDLAAKVLRERFDATGRVLELVNHAETTRTLPWATPENLRRAIQAVASRMDREHDVLVLYLTSHGASNFALAARHWPLEVPALTPAELRKALDDAGIRNRVIAISACYSGGWVEPLATDNSLVMTAADATHTSYGCGSRSELTFFGRALWDEQLRRTHSFEDAFAAAVPVIRQREIEGSKPDGFSNPQIRVGAAIQPVLAELARRLDHPPAARGKAR